MAKFSCGILNHIGKAILNVSIQNTLHQFLQLVTTYIKVWSHWEVDQSILSQRDETMGMGKTKQQTESMGADSIRFKSILKGQS